MSDPPVVLTIGGWDSGGCYGVPADLRALAARGVHAAAALTVVTAQNTTGLRAASPVPPAVVAAQIEAVLDDLPVRAVKTGMLGRVEVIEVVGALAASGRLPQLVVDPVLVDRHGTPIFGDDVIDGYRELLLPHALLVCPNRIEAGLLAAAAGAGAGTAPADDETLARSLGVPAVVTAGRSGGEQAVDVLWDGASIVRLPAARITTENNAGSGDAFSAHVAASLATGAAPADAVADAKRRVHAALRGGAGWRLGAGPGPLDHLGWSPR